MSGFQDFTALDVYRLSERLGDTLWYIVVDWSPLAQDTVGKQLIRAADSIGSNISEGHGSGTHAENRRFVRYSKRSLNETRHWLRRCQARKLISPDQSVAIHQIMNELRPKLINYLASIGRRRN